jgi:hypothetical protein
MKDGPEGKPTKYIAYRDRSDFLGYSNAWADAKVVMKVGEITGIAGEGKFRQVEFTCYYEAPPQLYTYVEKESSTKCTGAAILQLYDDGWRVGNVDVKFSR